MRILLATNVFGEGNTGLLVAQALNNLGHSVLFWNLRVKEKPPEEGYDLAIIWINRPIPRHYFKTPVAFVYLDDPEFWDIENPKYSIDNCTQGYQYVFTNMKWGGFDGKKYIFIPMGCLPEVHGFVPLSDAEKKKLETDVVFIGTNRGKRAKLVREFREHLDKKYSLKVYGNNWKSEDIKTVPVYFYDFSSVLSASKIVITEHWKNGCSTNDFEKPAVGGALMITDCQLVKQIYPMCPIYSTPKEAAEIALYYLEHEEERIKIVKEMQKIALTCFSYENQLNNIIKICMGEKEKWMKLLSQNSTLTDTPSQSL